MKKTSVLFCLSLFGCLTAETSLQAQAVLSGAGGIDLKGGSAFVPSSQTGLTSRFLWLPDKAALRFGRYNTTPNPANVGQDSIAGGFNASAQGQGSVAFGYGALASGDGSLAIGGDPTDFGWGSPVASDFGAIALGLGSAATKPHSVAIGSKSVADMERSAAFGFRSEAHGEGSLALGPESLVFGMEANAIGFGCHVYSDSSTAIGSYATADGKHSTAIGYSVYAGSVGGVAIGHYNEGRKKDGIHWPDPNVASPDDPIFEIGTGDVELSLQKNALTIFRDGTVRLSKASGGISMGQFQ